MRQLWALAQYLAEVTILLTASALLFALTVGIWVMALVYGSGRILLDVNGLREGWLEVGLFSLIAAAVGIRGIIVFIRGGRR